MQINLEWNWDILENNPATHTKRARVIGGWLVHHSTVSTKGLISESMVFVADRDHQWNIRQPLPEPQLAKDNLAKDF